MNIRILLFFGVFLFCNVTKLTAQSFSLKDTDDVLTSKEKQRLERAIRYQADFFNKVFPYDSLIKISDVKMVILEKYIDYISYEVGQNKPVGNNMPVGYFNRRTNEIVFYKPLSDNFLFVAYHELSHYFLSLKMRRNIAWLHEGLACYFESMNISARSVKIGKHSRYTAQLKTLVALNDVDIADFITWNANKFRQMSYNGYPIAYGTVYFLMQKDENILINIMRIIENGQSSTDAFNQFYPGGLAQFEKDFFDYFK